MWESFEAATAAENHYILERFGELEEKRLLDVGCGMGEAAVFFAMRGARVVACARVRGLAHIKEGEITAIPFATESFDLVTALDVVEHVEEDGKALSEIFRVLRPGGMAILTVPAFPFLWSPHDEVNYHKRRYTAGELRRKVREAGFRIVKLSYYNTVLFVPIALARMFRLLFPARREQDRSDFSLVNRGILNTLLAKILSAEARFLRRVDLPFRVSFVGVAQGAHARADGHL